METGRPAPSPLELHRTQLVDAVAFRVGLLVGVEEREHRLVLLACPCPHTCTCPCKGAPAEGCAAQHLTAREHEVPLEQPSETQQPLQGPAQAWRRVRKPHSLPQTRGAEGMRSAAGKTVQGTWDHGQQQLHSGHAEELVGQCEFHLLLLEAV
eukprot:CAMPEP_0173170020 /NCGR_PEP_ID=MMETSP1141-20130122/1016_1 /TAXON_ID=483371 /ORGANISM="non described non described, Strain CCMP2298" /LENGTH=152 /DNA_ID=CAMNT_0014091889 /DNA_START=97 /DNA_END=556 /DNA_ORIENTATION=-